MELTWERTGKGTHDAKGDKGGFCISRDKGLKKYVAALSSEPVKTEAGEVRAWDILKSAKNICQVIESKSEEPAPTPEPQPAKTVAACVTCGKRRKVDQDGRCNQCVDEGRITRM